MVSLQLFSGVTASGPAVASDGIAATLTCSLAGVTASTLAVSGAVKWTGGDISGDVSATNSEYTLTSGDYDTALRTRVDTFVISTAVLARMSGGSQVLTCVLTVGASSITDTHSMAVLSPG